MKKKLCIVIQRYGTEIVGGAETYCRIYAEKLNHIYDVLVITTCAIDYLDWKNHFPEGDCHVNGVRVKRFSVDAERDFELFGELCQKLYNDSDHTPEEAAEWLYAQGPLSWDMIDFIRQNRDNFDVFIFMTYMYFHAVKGLPIVKNNAVLIPFAHDEPAVYLKCYDEIFSSPAGIVFNSDEERDFIHKRFKNADIPFITTGIGIDIPDEINILDKDRKFNFDFPYIIYMGRIANSKGCEELFECFVKYKNSFDSELHLVLVGKELLDIPEQNYIHSLGFVCEHDKFAVLKNSLALVLPSHFESLSIVVLEAFSVESPVIVSGHSEVLKGHCEKSNGGLYFYGEADFFDCLNLLQNNPELAQAMGRCGKIYVDKNYQWDIIMSRLVEFLNSF